MSTIILNPSGNKHVRQALDRLGLVNMQSQATTLTSLDNVDLSASTLIAGGVPMSVAASAERFVLVPGFALTTAKTSLVTICKRAQENGGPRTYTITSEPNPSETPSDGNTPKHRKPRTAPVPSVVG